MEEEGGDDSEMIDAMEGWDSEDGEGDEGKKKQATESGASWEEREGLIFCELII